MSEIKVKKSMSASEVCTVLDDLVKSIREGKVCIESDEEFITLNPAEKINLEIEAEMKKDKQKMTIELNWRRAVLQEQKPVSILKISSQEPVIENVETAQAD